MAFWPTGYASKRTLWTRDGQNRDLVFQSGFALLNFKGTGSAWRRDELFILTDAVWQGTPTIEGVAALASISNSHEAVDAGWATDAVNFAMWDSRILIRVNLAVSDIDGNLNRVAYHCTAVGTLGGWPKG
jgi:hypothetical protein